MHTVEAQAKVSVASRRHLATVIIVLMAVGAVTLVSHHAGQGRALEFQSAQRLPIYLRVAVFEWLLFAYLLIGMRRSGVTITSIIDNCPSGVQRWFSHLGLGIGAALLWLMLGAVIMAALRPTPEELRTIQSFLPRSAAEKIGFTVMTLTAGFCEEFIYRGYLQRQFQALTGSVGIAIVAQAVLFAPLHLTLPWKFVVSVTAMALFLGTLTAWRKTLVPAMLVHTAVNLFGGLLSST